jgi:hypothetical protein
LQGRLRGAPTGRKLPNKAAGAKAGLVEAEIP